MGILFGHGNIYLGRCGQLLVVDVVIHGERNFLLIFIFRLFVPAVWYRTFGG